MPAIFGKITNPYMPNGIADQTNAPTPMYAPGELGKVFVDQNSGNAYLRVLLDSGAVAAASNGVVKANQLAFWKDRSASLVTNDPNFNDTGTPASCVGRVAGVFRTAVTAAPGQTNSANQPIQYYCDLLVQGKNVLIQAAANATVVPGATVIADGVTGGAKTLATVTTALNQQSLGSSKSSTVSGGTFLADLNIGFID